MQERRRARNKKEIDTQVPSGWGNHYQPRRQAEMDNERKDVIGMKGGRCRGTMREAGEKILGFSGTESEERRMDIRRN